MANVDLEKLKSKRTVIRTGTTKLINKIESKVNELAISDDKENIINALKEFREQLVDKENALKGLNLEIEAYIEVSEMQTEVSASEEYSEKIILWKQRISNQIDKWTNVESNVANFTSQPAETTVRMLNELNVRDTKMVKLPKLSIRTYYGDPVYWLEFFNQFENAIDKNSNLTKIDKFNYLKSYLGGKAANCISGFALTSENYDAALNLLKNRFGNNNTLIQAHLNQLLKISPVRNINDVVGLRKLFDNAEVQVRSLETLGVETETFGNLLSPILFERIPKELVLEFNRNYSDNWNFKDLFNFLDKEIQSRERTYSFRFKSENYQNSGGEVKCNFRKFDSKKKFNDNRYASPSTVSYAASAKRNCVFCNSPDHEFCEYKTVEDRKNKLKMENRCFKCFSKFHLARFCRLKIVCKNCKSKSHGYLLCESETDNRASDVNADESQNTVIAQCNSLASKSNILLLTCSAIASSSEKRSKLTRVLLDNGSERSWITKSLADNLKLQIVRKERLSVYSFGSLKAVEKLYSVAKLKLTNRNDSKRFIEIEALITETITVAPITVPCIDVQNVVKKKGLVLADVCVNSDQSVQVLIGADVFWNVIDSNSRVERINSALSAVPTIFGFSLQGIQKGNNSHSVDVVSANLSVGTDVQVLWDLESLGIKERDELSIVDKCLIDQFESDLNFVDGKYETRLLWKSSPSDLASNFHLAEKRFDDLKNSFENNEWVAAEYKEIIQDQYNKGIIEECVRDTNEYFMPHRAVVRADKDTTRVRVVFNCSSKTKQGISLNDCLETGPNLNPNILDVILNFRKFKIAFSADIEKAFLMISIAKEDRKYLKFLWFSDNKNENYKIMRMTRLPFGCKTSPFILSATIKSHIKSYMENKPKCVEMLSSSLYVDDLYYGGNSVEEALELSVDAVSVLREGGFNLRKLKSNSDELRTLWVQNGLCENDKEDDSQLKVLGLKWNPEKDVLSLEVKGLLDSLGNLRNTKRSVLQIAAMVFDPVGFLTPFVVRIKCLLQETWERGVDWDEELPDDISLKWFNWCSEIKKLKDVVIERNFLSECGDPSKAKVEVHVFCDASPKAYGAVVYFRYMNNEGELKVSFVMSKGRVAPLKKLSLPRLELMAVVIGARIGKYLRDICNDLIGEMVFWTDSLIALFWIKGCAKRWKQFVSNRVLEVQEKSDPKSWFHCRSEDNPADLVTRGVPVENLIANEKWWTGPHWLRESRGSWPKEARKESPPPDVLEEEIKASVVKSLVVNFSSVEECWNRFSDWTRLLRVLAWCLRFVSNLRGTKVTTSHLEIKEITKAHNLIIKVLQKLEFEDEISLLKSKKMLSHSSKLVQLNPFLDHDGLLRVGGRLKNASLPEDTKHPIIVPKSHHITDLIIRYYHLKYLHGGTQLISSAIRQKYWIISARAAIRRIVRKCVMCSRYRCELSKQVMSDLPASRVTPGRAFSRTGLDFAGPFQIKPRRGRGVRPVKIYVCVFVCFITKAVHLEPVNDLTSEACIASIKRFIARRGKPQELYSDCGTNFVGAKNLMQAWRSKCVINYLSDEGVEWRFNPPAAPHFGGLWEAAVKSMKFHMRRVIGAQVLTHEEFSTFITEIEATLNSRPLVSVSSDPDDFSVITPGHFLIGTSLKGIQEPNMTNEKLTVRDRWKLVTQLKQSFWKRWSSDYLTHLQTRGKWRRPLPNLQVNDLVLIKEDDLPPLKWKMGRVTQAYPGSDNKVRVTKVKTACGELKRPVHKLVLLPVEN